MKTYKLKKILLLLVLSSGFAFSQTQKLQKTYNTSADVKVNVDTKNANIIVETWDKNQVEITANLNVPNNADTQKMLENWKLITSAGNGEVNIISGGGEMPLPDMDMTALNESMGKLGDIMKPLMQDMVAPMMKNLANHPLPPDFYDKMGKLDFDYEAYKKDGDKYMKKFEARIKENFGDDFDESMEKWAAQFEKNSAQWAKDSTEWKKDFEMKMEDWGENFGKGMEKWGEEFGENMETWGKQFEETHKNDPGMNAVKMENASKANKTIRIKMPKNGNLNLNVRYGEVKLGQNTNNLHAELSHSKLTANEISGDNTVVHVAYTPVKINTWNYGVLHTAYVENCELQQVKSIKLESNSSQVHIGAIQQTGILSGNFAELKIDNLSPNFKNLNISLSNSDVELSLPETALNFNYKGTQSSIDYPKANTLKSSKSYDSEIVNGYYKANNAGANVNINASFSEVTIK